MELPGDAFQPGPHKSSSKEKRLSQGLQPKRTESSSSSSGSETSGEDWLIKIRCPAARHRTCNRAKKKPVQEKPSKTEVPQKSDKDEWKESAEQMSSATYQTYPLVRRKQSTDLEWLIRLRCPGCEMELKKSDQKQPFLPSVSTSLSISPSKTFRSDQSEKVSEGWPTEKDLYAQDVDENQDIVVTVRTLLERENNFMREVDRYLRHSDFLAERRREMLYKKWYESVSRPLLQKIQDKIDNQSSEEIEEKKRKQLALYLDHCNKKKRLEQVIGISSGYEVATDSTEINDGSLLDFMGSVCLENYNPSLYDPFFLKTHTSVLKASVTPICDPLLKEIQGRYLEAGIIEQCNTGKIYTCREMNELHKVELPLLPLSRQLMNPLEWMKIQFGYVDSDVRLKSRKKMKINKNVSSMDFKNWGDSTRLLPHKGYSTTRKPDFTSTPNLLAKRSAYGSSVWKPAIKSAS